MATGTVKFFNAAKGFGFITQADGGKDVFVHITGVKNGAELSDGQAVEYTVEKGDKGLAAVDVRVI